MHISTCIFTLMNNYAVKVTQLEKVTRQKGSGARDSTQTLPKPRIRPLFANGLQTGE